MLLFLSEDVSTVMKSEGNEVVIQEPGRNEMKVGDKIYLQGQTVFCDYKAVFLGTSVTNRSDNI